jgi:hypothetical protein
MSCLFAARDVSPRAVFARLACAIKKADPILAFP